jgi:tRNA/rRNA methyltransferase
MRIPTAPRCVSMNLGQAVAVCAYELARAGVLAGRPPRLTVQRSGPADLEALERLLERAAHVLDVSGYLKPQSRHAMLIKLRRLLLDLELSSHDARVLGGILAQVEWNLAQRADSE